MILPGGKYHVFLATRPVDFRKGHAGLSLVIQTVLGRDPYSGAVFVFRSKRGDRIKILLWGLMISLLIQRLILSLIPMLRSNLTPILRQTSSVVLKAILNFL